jgi:ABC-type transporter Mla subunit MlaD
MPIALSMISDVILIALLVVTLVAIHRFNRKLVELRQGREAFERLIVDFRQATGQADTGLQQLRQLADTRGRELQERTESAATILGGVDQASADLRLLIERADRASDRLEEVVAQSRDITQALSNQPVKESTGLFARTPLVTPAQADEPATREPSPIASRPTEPAAKTTSLEAAKRNSMLSTLAGIR